MLCLRLVPWSLTNACYQRMSADCSCNLTIQQLRSAGLWFQISSSHTLVSSCFPGPEVFWLRCLFLARCVRVLWGLWKWQTLCWKPFARCDTLVPYLWFCLCVLSGVISVLMISVCILTDLRRKVIVLICGGLYIISNSFRWKKFIFAVKLEPRRRTMHFWCVLSSSAAKITGYPVLCFFCLFLESQAVATFSVSFVGKTTCT